MRGIGVKKYRRQAEYSATAAALRMLRVKRNDMRQTPAGKARYRDAIRQFCKRNARGAYSRT